MFVQLLVLLGKWLFLLVVKSLLESFVCEYDSGKYLFYQDNDIECYSGLHILYVSLSSTALIIYCFLAILLLPNLQYQAKALDLKFKSTYIIIEACCKLFMGGASVSYWSVII